MTGVPAALGDLYEFDAARVRWSALDAGRVRGSPPLATSGVGFAAANESIYVVEDSFAGPGGLDGSARMQAS
jgi:hypothetical protein